MLFEIKDDEERISNLNLGLKLLDFDTKFINSLRPHNVDIDIFKFSEKHFKDFLEQKTLLSFSSETKEVNILLIKVFLASVQALHGLKKGRKVLLPIFNKYEGEEKEVEDFNDLDHAVCDADETIGIAEEALQYIALAIKKIISKDKRLFFKMYDGLEEEYKKHSKLLNDRLKV